ncbi:MAG: 16S rRNA (uracil(1498)-N(3))-methyltransferase [Candidatus Dasytiphilus stammeri]
MKNIPRIYYPYSSTLQVDDEIILTTNISNYITNVLRMTYNNPIQFFNGKNSICNAKIISYSKKFVRIKILNIKKQNCESPLYLHLGQVISRGEKMTFSIKKAVELGVNVITPLFSERCGVQLTNLELIKKQQRWKNFVIAACEQCGRNYLPKIRKIMTLSSWCKEWTNSFKIYFHPHKSNNTSQIKMLPFHLKKIRLLIGSEGGISEEEVNMINSKGFINVSIGPRILRTETATLAAIAVLQSHFGDLG